MPGHPIGKLQYDIMKETTVFMSYNLELYSLH